MQALISKDLSKHVYSKENYYSFQSDKKFIDYFFPQNINIKLINNQENSNSYDTIINIIGSEYEIPKTYETNKINIYICVENCYVYKFYEHYNKYGNYGNENIDIYFYNHIDKLVVTEKYISIPIIYTQINYFINNYNNIMPSEITPFNKKKFCLFVSNNKLNTDVKNKIKAFLEGIDKCDTLDLYKNEIKNESCYHSIKFLNILNKYKFVFVCENSIGDGYITEKIFNCLFAKTIPIYYGSKKINYFINKNCFINMNNINESDNNLDTLKNEIIKMNNNENKFNTKIKVFNKISSDYNDENYKVELEKFIIKLKQTKLNNTKLNNTKLNNTKLNYKLIILLFIFIFVFILVKFF